MQRGASVDTIVSGNRSPENNANDTSSVNASRPPENGNGLTDTIQSLLGFLIAGFAAILSFIGISSGELSSILRNEESFVGIVALGFLLSIITAILSIFQGKSEQENPSWSKNRFAIAGLLFLFAFVTLLPAIIHIPFVTSPKQVVISIIFGAVVITFAIAIALYGGPRHGSLDGRSPNGRLELWKLWSNKNCNPQLYLILASILFLTIAAYAALRLESASQASPFAQLDGSVTVANSDSAVLSLSVASAKVPGPDRVDITVTGLPRTTKIETLCQGAKTPPGAFSCAADPCSYKPSACDSLVGWTIPPNATGAVQETLAVPFSPTVYQRLHIEDQLCQRANATMLCAKVPPGGTHLDVEVPAPPVLPGL